MVAIPHFAFGEVRGLSRFACGGGSGWIERVVRGSIGRDGEGCAIALEIKNRVLEEAEVSFAVAPWTRNGHKIGGEFLFEVAKLLVVGLSRDARESPVGHLGPDGLGGYRIGHGANLSASTKGWRAMRANDEGKAGNEGAGADAVDVRGIHDCCRNSCRRSNRNV